MTAKAALCASLLKGEVINIMNCFKTIGLTNAPREISRMVEKPFGVTVSRTPMKGKTRWKQSCTWYNYRLNRSKHNLTGMAKMMEYVQKQVGKFPPKTISELKQLSF
jgi:hypothetical protein